MIPVLHRVDLLRACLASIGELITPPEFEVIVVANGSPAGAVVELSGREDIVLTASPVNLGFAGGCNWGARFARGRFLVLLNDDTEVYPDWLRALVDVAAHDGRAGAVGSRIEGFDGRLQEAGCVLWRDGATHPVGAGLPAGAPVRGSVRQVDYCSACGLLVPLQAWREVGGLDEAYYPAYHEDVDLCLSLRAAGLRVLCAPAARLRHHRGGSAAAVPLLTFAAVRNGARFRSKWATALAEYDPPPRQRHLREAIETAVRRASVRREGPRVPRPGVPVTGPPTEVEALQAQVRALSSDARLKDDYIAHLEREMIRRRQPRATLEHLRPLARGVRGLARRAAGPARRATGSGRGG